MQGVFTTEGTEHTEKNLKLGIFSSSPIVANSPSNCPHRASLWTEKTDRGRVLSKKVFSVGYAKRCWLAGLLAETVSP